MFLLPIRLLQPISLPGFWQIAEQYGIQILVNSFIKYGTDPLGMVVLHSIQRILADFLVQQSHHQTTKAYCWQY